MREIKFRAWDKIKNEMHYPNEHPCSIHLNGVVTYNKNKLAFDIMQYTGLKDKNGKEIYEGDIIEYRPFKEATPTYWTVKIPNIYISMDTTDIKQIEIIGNIYENPELIK